MTTEQPRGHDCNAWCVFQSWVSDIRGGLPNTDDLGVKEAYEAIRAETAAPLEEALREIRRHIYEDGVSESYIDEVIEKVLPRPWRALSSPSGGE